MTMGSFEASHLTKRFGTAPPSVQDLSFRFDGAGAIGYVGPNGAGKTTTLKLLVGLLRPTKGRVALNGVDPVANRRRALWDVGAVIETPEPYPTLTVHESLDLVGRARGLSTQDIDREIDRTNGLLHLPRLGHRIGWLSKGQRQRVVLAAALLGDPSVLLLDEPTSGLDPAERVLVRGLLNRLKQDHLILMSSHQMLEVTEVCDRALFLDHGRLVLESRVDELESRRRLRDVLVQFLRPVPWERSRELAHLTTTIRPAGERGWRVTFEGTDETRAAVLEACRAIAPVVEFESATLAVEDAYLDVIPTDRPAPVGTTS